MDTGQHVQQFNNAFFTKFVTDLGTFQKRMPGCSETSFVKSLEDVSLAKGRASFYDYSTILYLLFLCSWHMATMADQPRVVISDLKNAADYQEKQILKASKKARTERKTTATTLEERLILGKYREEPRIDCGMKHKASLLIRPHKKYYLFSVPARPKHSARPNFFYFYSITSLRHLF